MHASNDVTVWLFELKTPVNIFRNSKSKEQLFRSFLVTKIVIYFEGKIGKHMMLNSNDTLDGL